MQAEKAFSAHTHGHMHNSKDGETKTNGTCLCASLLKFNGKNLCKHDYAF